VPSLSSATGTCGSAIPAAARIRWASSSSMSNHR
jgi:hypothetical protein